ncbi:hypothetical protein LP085_08590 [Achromobacter sp. MY14]|uniref:hypothetical protein n=1 Tax=unclassified Achromobacter TaxID=2626865 RepID=UPI001E3641B2|nr:hypothetical protein [Achromobacter sp. MY14]MCD0496901.1 hypothetical protein [Achromobacter sp. MY14]
MSAQHTPGPWLCTKAKHGVDADHYVIATLADDRGDRCLIIHAEVGDDSQVEANAHLLVGAPNLLQAAQRYLNALDTWDGSGKAERHTKRMEHDLRAAVAKAKGEQQ